MSRTTLRLAVAVAILAASALPPVAVAQGIPRLAGADRGLLAGLWDLLADLFLPEAAVSETGILIDPNGATADCDSRITIDPDGRDGCAATTNSRITIDPNG